MKNFLGKSTKVSEWSNKKKLIGGLVISLIVIVIIFVTVIFATASRNPYSRDDQIKISNDLKVLLAAGNVNAKKNINTGLWASSTNKKTDYIVKPITSNKKNHTSTKWSWNTQWPWNINNNHGSFLWWNPYEGNGGELELYFCFELIIYPSSSPSSVINNNSIYIWGHISNSTNIYNPRPNPDYTKNPMPKHPKTDWFKNKENCSDNDCIASKKLVFLLNNCDYFGSDISDLWFWFY